MPEIMTLEGLDAGFDEGFDGAKSFAKSFASSMGKGVIAEIANDPEVQAFLRRRAYEATRAGIRKVFDKKPTEAPSPWMQALEPLLVPIEQGISQGVREFLTPLLVKASLIVAGGGVLVGWLVGKAHARRG